MPKKKKKAARKAAPKNREMLVVASKVKAYVRNKGMNTSADALGCLSDKLYCVLDEATDRTNANGRKTLKPQDI